MQAQRKEENLRHEQRRHWEKRALDESTLVIIINDLGFERNSEYALEQVYNVADSRYLSRLPFIITTNLSLDELKKPKDLAHARIYDRVLERCVPICFAAVNYRLENRASQREDGSFARDGEGRHTRGHALFHYVINRCG